MSQEFNCINFLFYCIVLFWLYFTLFIDLYYYCWWFSFKESQQQPLSLASTQFSITVTSGNAIHWAKEFPLMFLGIRNSVKNRYQSGICCTGNACQYYLWELFEPTPASDISDPSNFVDRLRKQYKSFQYKQENR